MKNDRLEVRSALAAEKKKTQEIVQKYILNLLFKIILGNVL